MTSRPNRRRLCRLLVAAAAGGSLAMGAGAPAALAVDIHSRGAATAGAEHPRSGSRPPDAGTATRGRPHGPEGPPTAPAPEPAYPSGHVQSEPEPDPHPDPIQDPPPSAPPTEPPAAPAPAQEADPPPTPQPPPTDVPDGPDGPPEGDVDEPADPILDPVTPIIDDLAPPAGEAPAPPADDPESEEKAAVPRRNGSDDAGGGQPEDDAPDPDPPDPPVGAQPAPGPPGTVGAAGSASLALGPTASDASLPGPERTETESAMRGVVAWLADQGPTLESTPDTPGDPTRIAAALGPPASPPGRPIPADALSLVLPPARGGHPADTGSGRIGRLTAAWAADPEAGQARVLRSLGGQDGLTAPSQPTSAAGWDIVDAGTGDTDLGATIDALLRGL